MNALEYLYALPLNDIGLQEIIDGVEHSDNIIDGALNKNELDAMYNDGTLTRAGYEAKTDIYPGEECVVEVDMIGVVLRELARKGHENTEFAKMLKKAKETNYPLFLFF